SSSSGTHRHPGAEMGRRGAICAVTFLPYKLAHRGYRKKKVVGDRYIKLSRRQGGSWSREWVWAPLLCPTD
uniref:Uncharacterized protein n=1 Tax=Gopherus agassizii TaxID=38772 RepID=A0A452I6L9_9SAUR